MMTGQDSSLNHLQLGLHDSVCALREAVAPTSSCGFSEIRSCLHAVEVYLCRSMQDSAKPKRLTTSVC